MTDLAHILMQIYDYQNKTIRRTSSIQLAALSSCVHWLTSDGQTVGIDVEKKVLSLPKIYAFSTQTTNEISSTRLVTHLDKSVNKQTKKQVDRPIKIILKFCFHELKMSQV